MSMYYAEHGKAEEKKYTKHGRTKQSQKAETDINKLLERSARSGALSHLDKYEGTYGDFAGYDFEAHITQLARGQSIFEELPAELKREFQQSPAKFFDFVNDPANMADLPRLLPKIADRGAYFPPIGVIKADDPAAEPAAVTPPSASGAPNTSQPALEETPAPPA